jgi:hypothetical protein
MNPKDQQKRQQNQHHRQTLLPNLHFAHKTLPVWENLA